MNAIKEFYADYVMPNGLIERTTFYIEPQYLNKIFIQEKYKNRVDKLIDHLIQIGTYVFEILFDYVINII